jgi:hypothetical protein
MILPFRFEETVLRTNLPKTAQLSKDPDLPHRFVFQYSQCNLSGGFAVRARPRPDIGGKIDLIMADKEATE